jgi:hypothetical protein
MTDAIALPVLIIFAIYKKQTPILSYINYMKKTMVFIALTLFFTSCISTKSTIQNIDDNASLPQLNRNNTFVITEYSKDTKYGYDKDVFYYSTRNETINQERFLNALTGPKGEKISFAKLESCCPFPTKRSEMGAGFLDVYEVKWDGLIKPVILYMNIYEKGALKVPVGFNLKKSN